MRVLWCLHAGIRLFDIKEVRFFHAVSQALASPLTTREKRTGFYCMVNLMAFV